MPPPKNDTLTLVDLFSGAGGLSCGLNMAGFASVMGSDIHPTYAQTFANNHPRTHVITSDVRALSEDDILDLTGLKPGELDLIAGGPPCQGFSINAPTRTLADPRNHLFEDYLRIGEVLRPKAILIENVPGLISLGQGTVVEAIYDRLHEMGYTVDHRILFAAHYGVPQMRFRTVFIALRDGGTIEFPEPTHNAQAVANFTGAKELCMRAPIGLADKTTVGEAISDLPELKLGESIDGVEYTLPPQSDFQTELRRGSKAIYNHSCARLGNANQERLKFIPQGGSWRDIPYDLLPAGLKRARRSDHTKRYGRLHPDQLCSTILTKCDPHWGSFFHPEQDRALSVREAARLQSFPDRYVFSGSLTRQFEQVGNAVPPLMAKAIGHSISRMIS